MGPFFDYYVEDVQLTLKFWKLFLALASLEVITSLVAQYMYSLPIYSTS